MRGIWFSRAIILVGAWALISCAAKPMVQTDRYADLSGYRAVQVILDPYKGPAAVPYGYEITSTELVKAFLDQLRASGTSLQVTADDPGAGKVVEARLEITQLNYVSGAGRGMGGIIAGRAVLGVTMTLRDKESGADLNAVRTLHRSSHGQGVFGDVTSHQITKVATEFSARIATDARRR